MNKYVIIVAGGEGKRMQSETPKQFLHVAGMPLLMHTLKKFYDFPEEVTIHLVLPAHFTGFWASLCHRFRFNLPHHLIEGGEARFFSVRNGLQNIGNNSLVAIHDGVRPLVSEETIHRVFRGAEEKGNAVPAIEINESIRQMDGENSFPVNRKAFRLMQTPQCFRSEILLKAYGQEYQSHFTDDATVVEAIGEKINLVDGNVENIKITFPSDLKIAESFLG